MASQFGSLGVPEKGRGGIRYCLHSEYIFTTPIDSTFEGQERYLSFIRYLSEWEIVRSSSPKVVPGVSYGHTWKKQS